MMKFERLSELFHHKGGVAGSRLFSMGRRFGKNFGNFFRGTLEEDKKSRQHSAGTGGGCEVVGRIEKRVCEYC